MPAEEAEIKRKQPFSLRAKKIGAVASTALTLGAPAGLNTLKSDQPVRDLSTVAASPQLTSGSRESGLTRMLEANLSNISKPPEKSLINTEGLTPFEKLPGWGMKVTSAERQRLKNATVRLAVRPRDETGPWIDDGNTNFYLCTAVEITPPKPRVKPILAFITSAHCAEDIIGKQWHGTVPEGASVFRNTKAPVVDLLRSPQNRFNYAIEGSSISEKPLALPNHFMIGRDKDTALITVDPASRAPEFNRIKPLDPNKYAFNAPLPGLEVFMIGLNENDQQMTSGIGINIGRINVWTASGTTQVVDLVALHAKDKYQDNCFDSRSGGSGILANGQTLGNTVGRYSIGYGPKHILAPGDRPLPQAIKDRQQLANLTGVAIPDRYNIICAFAAYDKNTLPNLEAAIQ